MVGVMAEHLPLTSIRTPTANNRAPEKEMASKDYAGGYLCLSSYDTLDLLLINNVFVSHEHFPRPANNL